MVFAEADLGIWGSVKVSRYVGTGIFKSAPGFAALFVNDGSFEATTRKGAIECKEQDVIASRPSR